MSSICLELDVQLTLDLISKAKTLFDSVEEQLEYLEDNILLDECHAAVLTDLGRFQEAAAIHIEEGRTMDAIKVLLEDKTSSESIVKANDYILRGLWQNTSFSAKIKSTDIGAKELLKLASKVDTSLLSATQQDEVRGLDDSPHPFLTWDAAPNVPKPRGHC